MQLGPVEAIRAVASTGVNRTASDVTPAFAVESSERMQDDSYGADAKRQDRGMEEDTVESGEDAEQAEEAGVDTDELQQVNLFA
jgi:hypothetical protein